MSLGTWLGKQSWLTTLRPAVIKVDRALYRLTGGRLSTITLSGKKGLTLISTGAKSGQRRENQMQYVPDGDTFLVIGSNWGEPKHPAWTSNLIAHPDVQANVRGRLLTVRAHLLDGDEREAAWLRMLAVWPSFEQYVDRSGRQLRIFRLVTRA